MDLSVDVVAHGETVGQGGDGDGEVTNRPWSSDPKPEVLGVHKVVGLPKVGDRVGRDRRRWTRLTLPDSET